MRVRSGIMNTGKFRTKSDLGFLNQKQCSCVFSCHFSFSFVYESLCYICLVLFLKCNKIKTFFQCTRQFFFHFKHFPRKCFSDWLMLGYYCYFISSALQKLNHFVFYFFFRKIIFFILKKRIKINNESEIKIISTKNLEHFRLFYFIRQILSYF